MIDALHETVNRLSCLTNSPVVVEDHFFNLVAHSPHTAATDQVRSDSILHRRCDDDMRRHFEGFGIARTDRRMLVPGSPDGAILSRWCLPIRWRGITQGYAWSFADPSSPAARQFDDAMTLATAIGELLIDRSRSEDAQSSAAGRLLEASDVTEMETVLADVVRQCGWSADQQVAVIVARSTSPRPSAATLRALAAVQADLPGSDAVLLVPHDTNRRRPHLSVRTSVAFNGGGSDAWSIGVGESLPLADVRTSWRQARAALGVADLGRDQQATVVRHWGDLGVRRLLSLGHASWLAGAAVPAPVRALLEHPDPDLVDTARTYLDLAGQAQVAADRLAIHRQTLYRRLRRVEEITGLDLMNGQHRLELHLALTISPGLANRVDLSGRRADR